MKALSWFAWFSFFASLWAVVLEWAPGRPLWIIFFTSGILALLATLTLHPPEKSGD